MTEVSRRKIKIPLHCIKLETMKIATLVACVSSAAAFAPSAFVPKTSMGVESSSTMAMALKDGESKYLDMRSEV